MCLTLKNKITPARLLLSFHFCGENEIHFVTFCCSIVWCLHVMPIKLRVNWRDHETEKWNMKFVDSGPRTAHCVVYVGHTRVLWFLLWLISSCQSKFSLEQTKDILRLVPLYFNTIIKCTRWKTQETHTVVCKDITVYCSQANAAGKPRGYCFIIGLLPYVTFDRCHPQAVTAGNKIQYFLKDWRLL